MHPLQQLADEYGITLNRLANESKLNSGSLQARVRANDPVTAGTLKTYVKIAQALDLTTGQLIDKLLNYH